ncbi:MAG: hypothetical protein Q9167_006542 [Letrouitia subvulpina]
MIALVFSVVLQLLCFFATAAPLGKSGPFSLLLRRQTSPSCPDLDNLWGNSTLVPTPAKWRRSSPFTARHDRRALLPRQQTAIPSVNERLSCNRVSWLRFDGLSGTIANSPSATLGGPEMAIFVHWVSDQKLKKIVLWTAAGDDLKPTDYSSDTPSPAGLFQLDLPEQVDFHFELGFESPGSSGNLQLYQFFAS